MIDPSDQSFWDTRFATEEYVFGEAPNGFLARQAPLLRPGMRALAVADGEGRNGVWLAQQGLDVLSIDFSPHALAKAQRLADRNGVAIATREVDLLAWQWPHAAFDVVAAIFIQFTGPADRAAMFAGMKQALRPGGLMLLEGYRPEQLAYGTGGPKQVENLYTEAMLREAFADFTIESLQSYDAELDEGPGHAGMSAVIDLVARKPL
ncbi:SAM-dependent methyltransferase [Stakelama tenebrarum]|uniref:Class I SAM-dependent methyltransferase n=1 Tax=Stakelama tenebrarum TaxID=2711215 RepID=A0A6G6Y6V5_9SPHN|nr:class I SAM-dependent methyltransferase [Sphingosinithalassobacter tenebrarum]QIG80581.1 class I SAM-dependent methyltransferase [Sphingosinithalassobacter tenebrarum]